MLMKTFPLLISLALVVSCADEDASYKMYGSSDQSQAQSESLQEEYLRIKSGGQECTDCVGSPTSIKMEFYALWMCTNADCTGCTKISDNGDNPKELNLFDNPVLFQGTPEDGTYNCLIMKAKDTMKFIPDAAAENEFGEEKCDSQTEYTYDTFRESDGITYYDMDGNSITPTGSVESPGSDTVYYFITTDTSAPTASQYQIMELAESATVPGAGTFIVEFENQIKPYSDTNHCWLEQPSYMGFSDSALTSSE